MAVRLLPAAWVSTQEYSSGAIVDYNGVRFVATANISANVSGNPIPVDNSSWRLMVFSELPIYTL